jgi:hypothetical protein
MAATGEAHRTGTLSFFCKRNSGQERLVDHNI